MIILNGLRIGVWLMSRLHVFDTQSVKRKLRIRHVFRKEQTICEIWIICNYKFGKISFIDLSNYHNHC